MSLEERSSAVTVRGVECRCDDQELREVTGEAAEQYRRDLERVTQGRGQDWLLRCPSTGQEWVENAPLDPAAREWVGTVRLRRFPW